MAGAIFDAKLDDAAAKQLFRRLHTQVRNAAPLYAELGSVLEQSTRDRFDTETSPEGVPWAPISEEWRKEKAERGFNTGILKMRGDLLNSTRFESDGSSTTIIQSAPYAAAHQFGAVIKPKKGRALLVRGRFVSKVVIPARPSLGLSADDRAEVVDAVTDFIRRVAAE